MRLARRPWLRRIAVLVMMAAAVTFALQGMFVATSEASTGDSSHYHLGFAFNHAHGEGHAHVVTHQHADGTVHRHAVDDDDDALDQHVKESGWNMALVVCVIPCPGIFAVSEIAGRKLAIAKPGRLRVAELRGLRRPPRPPSIA